MKFGDDAGAGEAHADDGVRAAEGPVTDHTAPDSPAAGIPTADRGVGAPRPVDPVPVRGETLREQVDNLHADMLGGTALGNHTELWNLVHAFKERVLALLAPFERDPS